MRSADGDLPSQPDAGRRRWCDGLPAATGEVTCGGQRHRITWRCGKLVLEDHDVLAERALTALGSEPPLCIEILDAWRRMRNTESLYGFLLRDGPMREAELASRLRRREAEIARGKQPPLAGSSGSPEVRRAIERRLAHRLESEKRRWDITLIAALPAPLRRALTLSVIVKIERHWHHEAYRRAHGEHVKNALAEIAHPLLEQSARRWRRNIKPYARFEIESQLLAPGEPPACEAWLDTDGACGALSLPLSWFIDIWARDAALVDGCFVLSRAGGSREEQSLPVVAVRWEREPRSTSRSVAAPAIVTRDTHGSWSLQWV